TAISRKSISVEVDEVDVARPRRVTSLEDTGTFIDQNVNAAIHDFFRHDLTLGDVRFKRRLADQFGHFGIGNRPPVFVVLVPAGSRLLAEASHLAQPILSQRLPYAGLLQVAILLANAPPDIQASQVTGRQWSHGHAKLVQRCVYSFHACALFNKEL